MKLEEFKQSYTNQKAEAEGRLIMVEAEVKRLTSVVHHFGGAIAAINDLEQEMKGKDQAAIEHQASALDQEASRVLRQAETRGLFAHPSGFRTSTSYRINRS